MLYGGTIRSGKNKHGQSLDIVSAFQSYGAYLSGDINEEQRSEIVQKACPGAGACGECIRPIQWQQQPKLWA